MKYSFISHVRNVSATLGLGISGILSECSGIIPGISEMLPGISEMLPGILSGFPGMLSGVVSLFLSWQSLKPIKNFGDCRFHIDIKNDMNITSLVDPELYMDDGIIETNPIYSILPGHNGTIVSRGNDCE